MNHRESSEGDHIVALCTYITYIIYYNIIYTYTLLYYSKWIPSQYITLIQPIGNNWVGLGIMPGRVNSNFLDQTQPCRHVVLFGKDGSFHIFLTYTAAKKRGHIFRNLKLGTCIAKWCLWKICTNSKLPTNGFVHCTRLASSYLDDLVFFPSKQHLWWLSCYLAAAKEDRRSAILSTADTALLSKQATWRLAQPSRDSLWHSISTILFVGGTLFLSHWLKTT